MICYEFLYGYPPFHAETPDKVFENILSRRIDWHEDVVDISPEARDFMERLMTLDPEKRLGYNGAEEVKNHPFFRSINWDTLLTESPAFVPQPADMEDTDYFDLRGATMLDDAAGHQQESLKDDEKAEVEKAKAIIQEQNPENLTALSDQSKRSGLHLSAVSLHESAAADDNSMSADEFGTFVYKNLPVLEKANEDAIRKIRHDSIAVSDGSPCTPNSSKLQNHRSLPAMPQRKSSTLVDMRAVSGTQGEASASGPATPIKMSPSQSSKTVAPRRSVETSQLSQKAVEKAKTHEGRARSASSPGRRSADTQLQMLDQPHPLAEQRPNGSSAVSSKPSETVKPTGPLNCLVADDNPISCKILETILHTLNCRCVIVRNGAQAIRSAMSDVRFDIIFMDIRMPISKSILKLCLLDYHLTLICLIVDGEAAARMIKSTNNINRDTPIIAVTAYERTVQLAGAFDDILSKPMTKDIIRDRLEQFCLWSVDQLAENQRRPPFFAHHSSSSSITSTTSRTRPLLQQQ